MPRPADARPAQILELVGKGQCLTDAAEAVGISRKTLYRWRETIDGFKAAVEHVASLSAVHTPDAVSEIERVVSTWAPGGLREVRRAPRVAPVEPPPVIPVMPDVLDGDGEEIVAGAPPEDPPPPPPKPRTVLRGQTADEWLDLLYRVSSDKREPDRVRATAMAAGASAVLGGPLGRKVRPIPGATDPDTEEVRKAIGRDPGVPKAVWSEIRTNVLGEPVQEDVADVVELDPAKRG